VLYDFQEGSPLARWAERFQKHSLLNLLLKSKQIE